MLKEVIKGSMILDTKDTQRAEGYVATAKRTPRVISKRVCSTVSEPLRIFSKTQIIGADAATLKQPNLLFRFLRVACFRHCKEGDGARGGSR